MERGKCRQESLVYLISGDQYHPCVEYLEKFLKVSVGNVGQNNLIRFLVQNSPKFSTLKGKNGLKICIATCYELKQSVKGNFTVSFTLPRRPRFMA